MKKIIAAALLASTLAVNAQDKKDTKKTEAKASFAPFKTEKEQVGYAFGSDMGRTFKKNHLEIDVNAFVEAFKATYGGGKPKIDEKAAQGIIQKTIAKIRETARLKQEAEAKENAKKGKDFLAKNAKEKGVKTTPTGLQYSVIKEGKGTVPKATDTVKVHYTGVLSTVFVDSKGKVEVDKAFDSSVKRKKPAEFPLNQVIKGWTEGLQLMKPGAKYRFFIKPELGYGSRGMPNIPANSVLVFDVELLEVVAKKEEKKAEKKKGK